MNSHLRLGLSAVLAAVLFGIGYSVAIVIPGVGNTPDKDFTSFYASDNKMHAAIILFAVIVVGSMAMLWFFSELRARLPDGMLASIGYGAALVGVIAAPAGVAIMVGPTSGQQAGNGTFVGIPTALAFAEAGLALTLGVGMTGFAVAAILMSLAARGTAFIPGRLAIGGVILGVVTLGSFFWVPGYAFLIWVLVTGVVVGVRGEAAG
jgi:hypothetical protein